MCFGRCVQTLTAICSVQTKAQSAQTTPQSETWLGFERLTCVPIQTKMVREGMLTKEERQWLRVRSLSSAYSSGRFTLHACDTGPQPPLP